MNFEQLHKDLRLNRGDRMLEESRVYFKEGGQQGFMAPYRIEIVGETKLEDDAGGIYRGWIDLVSQRLFHPEDGLFEMYPAGSGKYRFSVVNKKKWDVIGKTASLGWSEFAGRFLGKVCAASTLRRPS